MWLVMPFFCSMRSKIQNAGIFIYGHKDFQEEKWFDPDSKAVPKADELVLMALFFGCSTDYLIDLIE